MHDGIYNMQTMKPLVIILLTLGLMITSVHLLKGQTRTRADRRSQTRSQPTSNAPQKVSEDDVVRVNTNLVTIPISVRADNGTYLFDLRKEEFRIYEDGVEQEIAHFASVEQPFYVVVLIDISSST